MSEESLLTCDVLTRDVSLLGVTPRLQGNPRLAAGGGLVSSAGSAPDETRAGRRLPGEATRSADVYQVRLLDQRASTR